MGKSIIVDRVVEKAIEKGTKNLGLSALGARICYSAKPIEELINLDERVNNPDTMIQYLKRLQQMKHYSIFEHTVAQVDLKDIAESLMKDYTLRELFDDISTNITYLFDVVAADIYQIYPVLNKERELQGITDIIKLKLKQHFNIIPIIGNIAYVNFRHVLEYDNSLFTEIEKYKDTIAQVTISNKIPLNNKQANLYILKALVGESGKTEYCSFVLEGVSRILTHQLVRHRLFSSYSQRSMRHTALQGKDEFVYPPLDYIDKKKVRTKFLSIYESIYERATEDYRLLTETGLPYNRPGKKKKDESEQEELIYKVRKEDARFIIPDGVKTTIMITMIGEGLYNFIHERTDKAAQWEIREVAEKLSESLVV